MTSQLRKIRQDLGLRAKPITSGLQLPEFATIEQLEQYRDAGIAEMERDGVSQNYLIYQEALRCGIDQQLPSLRDMQGMATDEQSIYQETLAAAKSSRQMFDPERLDPRLVDLEIDGVPAVDWDQHELLNHLHAGMADIGDNNARGEIMGLIEAVQNSPAGSLGASIEINMPPPKSGIFEVASETTESTGDWYSDMRAASMRAPQGLESLAIGDGFDSNGLKGIGGGGGTYSIAHDVAYQQALAQGYFDNDGDDDDE